MSRHPGRGGARRHLEDRARRTYVEVRGRRIRTRREAICSAAQGRCPAWS